MSRKQLAFNIFSEFLPIASFVFISEIVNFHAGLLTLMITTLGTLVFSVSATKRLPKFGLFASGTILLFATLSLSFHNPVFIIIKDTLYYSSFSIALFIGLWNGRSPFKYFFEDLLAITERGWIVISLRWAIFFMLLAVGNEIARHILHPVDWTMYKLAALIVTWLFGFYQLRVTRDERLPGASPLGLRLEVSQVK